MKNALFLFFISIAITTRSQEYTPAVIEGHTWKEQVMGWSVINSTYWFDGDTTIGEQVYKKLYTIIDLFPDNIYLYGMYREDEATQKVYMWWNGIENLVYDFTVEAGDVVTIYPQGDAMTATVATVDTEWIGGVERKSIHFDFGWYTDSWVVGRGSSLGFTSPFSNFPDFSPQLNCFYIGNDFAWGNPLFTGECSAALGVNDRTVVPEIQIWPNPVSDVLHIRIPPTSTWTTGEVLDATGRVVWAGKGNDGFFEVFGLAPGCYFLKIDTDAGISSSKMFTVVH